MTPAEKAAAEFMCFINGASQDAINEFAKVVTDDHRTLQQSAFGLMLKCVEKWADDCENGYYDLRNEATVSESKKIVDNLADRFYKGEYSGMPFI